MENYAPAIEICRANIRNLGEEARATILACDVLHPHRAPAPCDIVFLDPPYNQGLAEKAVATPLKAGWIASRPLLTIELLKRDPLEVPSDFSQTDARNSGQPKLVFLPTGGWPRPLPYP